MQTSEGDFREFKGLELEVAYKASSLNYLKTLHMPSFKILANKIIRLFKIQYYMNF